eukprot:1231754-Rhodomonas_salina.3
MPIPGHVADQTRVVSGSSRGRWGGGGDGSRSGGGGGPGQLRLCSSYAMSGADHPIGEPAAAAAAARIRARCGSVRYRPRVCYPMPDTDTALGVSPHACAVRCPVLMQYFCCTREAGKA